MLIAGRIRRDERGVGVVVALIVTLVVFATGAMWAQQAVHQAEGSGIERSREQALAAAEAGLNAAMSRLSQNSTCPTGQTWQQGTLPGVGDWEYTFPAAGDARYVDCSDPNEFRRYIIARGYSPSKTAVRVQKRQLEQQIDLVATDGFRHALFAANGGITGANQITVRGDAYSRSAVTVSNNSTVTGNLTSYGAVTLQNSTLVTGKVWANGAVDVNTSGNGTGVNGDVWTSVGNINVASRVGGNAQAAGSITGGGTVVGTKTPSSPAPVPPAFELPTYTWASSNFSSPTIWAPPTYSSPASSFQTYFNANDSSFGGAHRITTCGAPYSGTACSPSVGAISFNEKWNMAGDTTIVSDGVINVSRDINSGTGNLVIVSNYPGTPCTTPSAACNAVVMSNNWSIPSTVKVLIFAQNGCVDVSNLKTFTGAIYARCIDLDNNFDLTYYPVTPPGFDWSTATSSHYTVQARSFREVPFGS
jgi:Tfp pilus assembly protein PilX